MTAVENKQDAYQENRIYCVDCLEALKQLKAASVDCVMTDPPYFIGFNSSSEGGRQDWGNNSMLTLYLDVLFTEFARILKPSGRVFMFTDWRTYPVAYFSAFKRLRVSNMIVWDYGWIKAGSQFRFTHELILHATMQQAPSPRNRSTSDVWRLKPVNFTAPRFHPADKPVEIIRKMLEETTRPGDVILDPFIGSGTTAVACKQLRRRYIGFEINPEYVAVAEARLKESGAQETLQDLAA